MTPPGHPKIYHIAHVDRLPSIVADQHLWCDREVLKRSPAGTTIGMNNIKERRLNELRLNSYPSLFVGDCVPFYFCPRSVMLFLIHKRNPDLSYKGGQGPIIHFEADLHSVVAWANHHKRSWVFTLSNAGSRFFEDRRDLAQLNEVDWNAVHATNWQQCKDGKQAEFLLETSFPWHLVHRIGVHSQGIHQRVANELPSKGHRPTVEIRSEWYY